MIAIIKTFVDSQTMQTACKTNNSIYVKTAEGTIETRERKKMRIVFFFFVEKDRHATVAK